MGHNGDWKDRKCIRGGVTKHHKWGTPGNWFKKSGICSKFCQAKQRMRGANISLFAMKTKDGFIDVTWNPEKLNVSV